MSERNPNQASGPQSHRIGALERARYRWFPDHLVGEVLSKDWIENTAPFIILVFSLALSGIFVPDFFGGYSMGNSARQLGEFGLIVTAMMIVMLAGGVDLSVGSNFAMGNLVALMTINVAGWPIWAGLVAAILVCGLIGLFNGILIGFLRLRAFLTTLVTLILVRAFTDMLLLHFGVQISGTFVISDQWDFVGAGAIFGIPFSMVVLAAVLVGGHYALTRTRPGWRVTAVGGSRRSAFNSGISVKGTICGAYVTSGILVGVSSFLYAARLSSANPDTGVGLEFLALTAAILGGNALGGGRGSAAKALMGAIIVLTATNSVVRLGFASGASDLTVGLILLFAAAIDVRWLQNRHKLLGSVYVSPTLVELPPPADTAPGSKSPCEINDKLSEVEQIGLGAVEGPEDLILDRDDNIYCGTRHGHIQRFLAPDYTQTEIFAHIGGYPLGLSFGPDGTLYCCVAGMGIYSVSPGRVVSRVTDRTARSRFSIRDDSALRLPDDLDIAPDGRIFFSEATTRYDMHEWAVDSLEGRGNGRILCFDPATGRTDVVLRGLIFPNGVCVSPDGQSIMFAETWACRVRRYWFDGPRKGALETVTDTLPGYPDNINRASDGQYWLAIVGMRTPCVELAQTMPGFRRRMSRRIAPDEWLFPNINTGCILKLSESGEITDALWDMKGANHPMITSMREHKGSLFIGGVSNNRIGRYAIAGADKDWTGQDSYWGPRG